MTTIGVGSPTSTTGVFTVNATTPAALGIYVFSNKNITPTFAPVTDINPSTVKINGVAYPNATLTSVGDLNGDGIPDALITITPRSRIGLTTSTSILTITGNTAASSPQNAGKTWGGSASITVIGSSSGGGGTGTSTGTGLLAPVGIPLQTTYQPPFGPDTAVPTIAALSAYSSYKPIPLQVALNQYLPLQGFRQRTLQYFYPKKYEHQFGSRKKYSAARTSTLGQAVFTRGNTFKPGKVVTFTHKVKVVPVQEQTQRFVPTPRLSTIRRQSVGG